MADRGTLFLDEIGDLPLELQPKLRRVLQEREFERLGSPRTIKVDVRIVAATNCDLAAMVKERRFRADLFYRLNVFPITLPPLRHRSEDIPELVWHFARTFGERMNKEISAIANEAMEIMLDYAWPGNIRELQNFIERAVIMSPGPVLRPPLGDLKVLAESSSPTMARTLAQIERDQIAEVLDGVGWVVGGLNGAAARLGLPRTTLMSRMNKLGIHRHCTGGAPSRLRKK
jgi:formate hydrogenlyase transcriptional activator